MKNNGMIFAIHEKHSCISTTIFIALKKVYRVIQYFKKQSTE